MLEIENLNVSYGITPILRDISLTVQQGEIIALLGSNGAGKTTLVNTIMGILKPTSGSIVFEGEHIDNLPPHEIVRRGIAQVPEGRKIFPYLSVKDNLFLGAYAKASLAKEKQFAGVGIRPVSCTEGQREHASKNIKRWGAADVGYRKGLNGSSQVDNGR